MDHWGCPSVVKVDGTAGIETCWRQARMSCSRFVYVFWKLYNICINIPSNHDPWSQFHTANSQSFKSSHSIKKHSKHSKSLLNHQSHQKILQSWCKKNSNCRLRHNWAPRSRHPACACPRLESWRCQQQNGSTSYLFEQKFSLKHSFYIYIKYIYIYTHTTLCIHMCIYIYTETMMQSEFDVWCQWDQNWHRCARAIHPKMRPRTTAIVGPKSVMFSSLWCIDRKSIIDPFPIQTSIYSSLFDGMCSKIMMQTLVREPRPSHCWTLVLQRRSALHLFKM